MAARILLEAGHYPNLGGAPGEAAWTHQLAQRMAAQLQAGGVQVTIVGSWFNRTPPPQASAAYELSLHLHYDAAVYGAGNNTGCFADRWRHEADAAAADRFIQLWEANYPALTGIPLRNNRRNPNTNLYYAYSAVKLAPSVLIEHGCGAPVGTGGFPPGQDAAFLHGQIDQVSAANVAAIAAYLTERGLLNPTLPNPPEPEVPDVSLLNDDQAKAAAAKLWEVRGVPYPPDFAIAKAWLSEWRQGRYRGLPAALEQQVEPGQVHVQPFDQGAATWVNGQEVSWEA